MRILITGGSGMVGKELKKLLPNAITPSSKELNLTNSENVKQYLKNNKFDYIVHLAAYVGSLHDNIENKTFSILGLSFKPNTDDVRDSTSMIIAESLYKRGAIINAYDPKAMENAKLVLPNINYSDSVKSTCINANAIIIATEWNEFRALDFKMIKKQMKDHIIFDLRNIYNKDELNILEFVYYGIGK